MMYEQLMLFTDEELGIHRDYRLIGLTGYARSGKDTVATVLVERFGYTRIGFADAIRDFLIMVNPILHSGHRLNETVSMYGWEIAKGQDEVRRLLQETGTVARDMFGEDFWINQAFKKLDVAEKVVFTDVRFPNEATAIKMLGGHVWRVERPGVNGINGHISESSMDNYTPDQLIVNSGSIEDLRMLVEARMRSAESA